MGVDWDLHLLSPLHGVFGDEHEYRPKDGTADAPRDKCGNSGAINHGHTCCYI